MEGFRFTPPQYDQQIVNPEQPKGQGTLEVNDSGKIETRNDEERREQKRKLLKFLIVMALLKRLKFK